MAVNQIYTLVNSIASQALGPTAITAVDTQSLVSLGNQVTSSNSNRDNFMNTLYERIGKTIISQRAYKSKFDFLLKDEMAWGGIVQKISYEMPEAEKDDSWELEDGQSIDQYKISKPKVKQSLFVIKTAWQIHKTFTRKTLKNAFTSESAMNAFIQGIYTAIQNALEFNLEQLGRATLGNYMAEVVDKPGRVINLLDKYNKEHGLTSPLKAKDARFDPEFLRYVVKEINKYSDLFTEMTKGEFNDGSIARHTPKELQSCLISLDWDKALATQMQYAAFNDSYVKLKKYRPVSYWQSIKSPESISVKKRASDGTAKKVDGILGCLFDVEALGMFKNDLHASTSPFNAAGEYFNTYWHAEDMRYNDLSENFLLFVIADV